MVVQCLIYLWKITQVKEEIECILNIDAKSKHLLSACPLPSTVLSLFTSIFRVTLWSWLTLWWVILCVNLADLRDTQIAGRSLFLVVSVKMFLAETSIWLSQLSEEICLPPPMWVASSDSLRAQMEQKGKGRASSLLYLGYLSSPAWDIWAPGCQAFRPWDLLQWPPSFSGLWIWTELYHWLPWFSSLLLAVHGTSWTL